MGSTEKYGFNRNADGFTEQMLREHHPSFVKNAHVYYHHDNKDPKKAFGKVAASLFNEDMGRVELLILLNGSKEAAVKNGGLVAPAEDIDALNSGKELAWSMGISVPHDICVSCQNKAAMPKDYCEEHECIDTNGVQRFGCKHGLTKTADDGFFQGVDNPEGKFKDISRVSTPADRTAYGAVAKYAAAHNEVLGGAELALARGDVREEYRIIKRAELQIYSDALTKLASFESVLRPSPEVLAEAVGFRADDELPSVVAKYAATAHSKDKCAYLVHLADYGVVLSPKQFAKYAGHSTSSGYLAAVKGLFGQLDRAHDHRLALLDTCTKYAGVRCYSDPAYFVFYPPSNFYTKAGCFMRRLEGVRLGHQPLKTAAAPTEADYKAAVEYCLYKVAMMTRFNEDIHYVTACIQNF